MQLGLLQAGVISLRSPRPVGWDVLVRAGHFFQRCVSPLFWDSRGPLLGIEQNSRIIRFTVTKGADRISVKDQLINISGLAGPLIPTSLLSCVWK